MFSNSHSTFHHSSAVFSKTQRALFFLCPTFEGKKNTPRPKKRSEQYYEVHVKVQPRDKVSLSPAYHLTSVKKPWYPPPRLPTVPAIVGVPGRERADKTARSPLSASVVSARRHLRCERLLAPFLRRERVAAKTPRRGQQDRLGPWKLCCG